VLGLKPESVKEFDRVAEMETKFKFPDIEAKNIIEYNSKVAANKKIEEANFARIKGNIAMQQTRLAQLQTVTSTGTSLLKMGGYIA